MGNAFRLVGSYLDGPHSPEPQREPDTLPNGEAFNFLEHLERHVLMSATVAGSTLNLVGSKSADPVQVVTAPNAGTMVLAGINRGKIGTLFSHTWRTNVEAMRSRLRMTGGEGIGSEYNRLIATYIDNPNGKHTLNDADSYPINGLGSRDHIVDNAGFNLHRGTNTNGRAWDGNGNGSIKQNDFGLGTGGGDCIFEGVSINNISNATINDMIDSNDTPTDNTHTDPIDASLVFNAITSRDDKP